MSEEKINKKTTLFSYLALHLSYIPFLSSITIEIMSTAFALLNLPDSLHLEILTYVIRYDRREYARTNRGFSSRLMKAVRDVAVGGRKGSNRSQFLTSEPLAQKILELIHNPSQQMRVIGVGMESVPRESLVLNVLPRKVQSVICNIHHFATNFLRHFKAIRRLELLGTYTSQKHISYMSSQLDRIAEAIQNDHLRIEELNLIRISNPSDTLPIFPGITSLSIFGYDRLTIEGLRIPEYSNLKILRLNDCSGITDVSCLDSIYELYLDYCPNIENISNLNHNHKIVIQYCNKIKNYSNSFAFSSFIQIEGSFAEDYITINMNHLQCVQTLMLTSHPIIFEQPLPTSLRVLHIESHPTITCLPENHLSEVTIIGCKEFNQLLHMKHIQRVHLGNLMNLTSLEGLGRGNHFISIRRCPGITDFTPLRNNNRLEVTQCTGFLDTGILNHVKEVSFEPVIVGSSQGFEVNCVNFEAATTLRLSNVPSNSSILATATRVATISVSLLNNHNDPDFEKTCLSFFHVLLALPSLRKVVLSNVDSLINEENKSHYQSLFNGFGYQIEHYQSLFVLLKRSSRR